MASRLASLSFRDMVAQPFDIKLYFPLPGEPQHSHSNLQGKLAMAVTELQKLSAEKVQLRNNCARQHSEFLWQLQQKDAQLQQQQQQLALQQQQLKQQSLQAAELRKQCEEQQMQLAALKQVIATRPKQQQKPELDASSKATIAPAAVAASPLAGCGPQMVIPSAQPSAADGKGHAFLDSADGVKLPEAPSPEDSRATYSPRSSGSSDDGCNSSDSSMPQEQTASAASSWWWWSPPTTSITSSTAPCSTSTSNSNKAESSLFSSWWMVDSAVDMAIGAAGDILYL